MDGVTGRHGLTVLVAESTLLLALALTGVVEELGHHVLGPAPSVREALALLQRQRPDLALLEAMLADGSTARLAATLQALQVPFALVTAHDRDSLADPGLRAAPYLGKPYMTEELRSLLHRLAAAARPR
jgi:CheY-like chemotaxis protein